jgi:AmmeMemoRadiSam system protein B
VRLPAVAGTFYPEDEALLKQEMIALVKRERDETAPEPAAAVLCPHAGWPYAGKLAGHTLAATVVPPRVIVLGPNHTGRGARQAVDAHGTWRFPGFDVPLDDDFAARLLGRVKGLAFDPEAHEREHAVEVLVPLLKQAQPALRLVPIVLGRLDLAGALALGEALAETVATDDDPSLLVLSSDLSHEATDAAARAQDRLAIHELEAVSPAGLFDVVREKAISMCGAVAATVGLAACRALGATAAELLGYATSSESPSAAPADRARVVGYAGLRFAERFTP